MPGCSGAVLWQSQSILKQFLTSFFVLNHSPLDLLYTCPHGWYGRTCLMTEAMLTSNTNTKIESIKIITIMHNLSYNMRSLLQGNTEPPEK